LAPHRWIQWATPSGVAAVFDEDDDDDLDGTIVEFL
jgi:hypothetical protein